MRAIAQLLGVAAAVCAAVGSAHAEIIAAAADRYELRHEAVSDLAPGALWRRLVAPATWWNGEHTYSGDADNLSLDVTAGGVWREDWDGGSVAHGRVLLVQHGKQLRLDAPFGPLQAMGVNAVWTITISPEGDGAKVVFEETATGAAASGLDKIAPAVDAVKAAAIRALAANPR